MKKCVVIDDEDFALELIERHIAQTEGLTLVYSSTNPKEGYDYIINNEVDIVFLDIQMPELKGTDIKKMLPSNIDVIFTTAHVDYAFEAFEDGAVDFLKKPVSYDRFSKAINKLNLNKTVIQESNIEKSVFIKVNNTRLKIKLKDIVRAEGMKNYIGFHTKDNKTYLSYITFAEALKILKEPDFIRINNSHIIAFNYIHNINGNEVVIESDKGLKSIPIGVTYRKNFDNFIKTIST